MTTLRTLTRATATGVGVAVATYATVAVVTWLRYGSHRRRGKPDTLDGFIPQPEVVEHHAIRVDAPCEFTYAAACETDLQSSPIIRAIIGTRKLVLGGLDAMKRQPARTKEGLIVRSKAMGWGVLAESPGREIVLGAVTQPWVASPVFHPLPADEFRAFQEPGWVKIAWNLRVIPIGQDQSVFITDTRVATTDAVARSRFRRYWSFVSPGVWLIRRLCLGPVKCDSERRFRTQDRTTR